MSPWGKVIRDLDALSRTRALTDEESIELEKALHRHGRKCERRAWTPEEKRELYEALNAKVRHKVIAKRLNRTPSAIAARVTADRLRAQEASLRERGVDQ